MAYDDFQPPSRGRGRHEHPDKLPTKFEIVDAASSADDAYGAYGGFDDEQRGLLEYWRILRRRKGVLLVGSMLGLLASVALTLPQTPVYQATTTLEIQSLNGNFMNMGNVQQMTSNFGRDGMLDLQTQIEILKSRTLVERVIEQLEESTAALNQQRPSAPSRVSTWRRALNLAEPNAEKSRELAISMAADTLTVGRNRQTRIVEISADSTDPQVASDFANLLTQEYIQQSVEARWDSTQQTSAWLARRLDETRIKVERSENALHTYARETSLLFVGQDINIDEEKLGQLQAQLTAAQGDRVSKQSRLAMATSAPVETLPSVLDDPSMRGYQETLTDLRQQRQVLFETYTSESQQVKRVNAQITSLRESVELDRAQIVQRITNEYDEAVRHERLLQQGYDEQRRLVTERKEKSIQYGILRREAETNRELHSGLLAGVQEAELANALTANNVRVVDSATQPEYPYKPSLAWNGLIGLFLGGVCAVGFVLISDRSNRTLRDPGDLQYYVGMSELGIVPSAKLLTPKKRFRLPGKAIVSIGPTDSRSPLDDTAQEKFELVTHQHDRSIIAESFRATLTSIQFSGNSSGPPSVIVITSPDPGEGKTTIASNLAIAMAETGQKVLLIDGDTRRPRLHDIFEIDNGKGLMALLKDRERGLEDLTAWTLDSLVQETQLDNLDVLPAGQQVAGPVHLFHSKHFSSVLQALRETYDTIFIDTPPMMHIPDARLLGKLADGVVLVLRAGSTTRDTALAAKLRLSEDGVNLIGAVMNDWNPTADASGRYGYYRGYSRYHVTYDG